MDILLFPPTCTNLIVGTSNCGKTFLVQHILKNFQLFFPHVPLEGDGGEGVEREEGGITRIHVVHCNSKTPRWPEDFPLPSARLKLSQFDIDEFDLNQVSPHSVVVFDDVSALHESITTTINVGSHHIPLLAVFVVSQNIVGTVHYALTKLCHRVIFCCNTVNALDAANNILRKQVSDVELRQHLQTILAFCHRERTKFLLELNNLATWPTTFYGYSHLGQLKPPFPYCLAYSMNASAWKKKMSVAVEPLSRMETLEEQTAFKDLVKNAKHLPENTMVVLPVSCLDLKQTEADQDSTKCTSEAAWDQVAAIVNSDIEMTFPTNKWREAKTLAARILNNDGLCVSRDGQFVWVKHQVHLHHNSQSGGRGRRNRRRRWRQRQYTGQAHLPTAMSSKPENKVNLLNFIRDVNRPAMPTTESLTQEWRQYRQIVQVLKARGAPSFLFKNKVICK